MQISCFIHMMEIPIFLIVSLVMVLGATDENPHGSEPPLGSCVRCCEPAEKLTSSFTDNLPNDYSSYPLPHIGPTIDVTILKGDKGENGEKGLAGKSGNEGPRGATRPLWVQGDERSGKFSCYTLGVYFFNLNVHTWSLKKTSLHIMKNDVQTVVLYAQPSDHSSMQSQSLLLDLQEKDEVWIRLDNTD
ncbi:Complement C1q tumor necrosis factor-related protein 1 [Acipenser ruthenus]|uniref:Complement C1q tumor necrosis factor-related protein 1 n=1 Tax=Acipenser ruthenus TaxID=7906 RepID=A0A444TXS1_ACIRT|nr:Complement C1q tumor necrosis factor-related protein 1 [Acipenser ruthenus]